MRGLKVPRLKQVFPQIVLIAAGGGEVPKELQPLVLDTQVLPAVKEHMQTSSQAVCRVNLPQEGRKEGERLAVRGEDLCLLIQEAAVSKDLFDNQKNEDKTAEVLLNLFTSDSHHSSIPPSFLGKVQSVQGLDMTLRLTFSLPSSVPPPSHGSAWFLVPLPNVATSLREMAALYRLRLVRN
uniref:Uncharacterized protein n=1 Tax=Chromera velia CCMP2878 TaxID=1169474 RepID=A0A0G4HNQ7_9ALVE|eukprot:Cvel_7671.t1-p1 / transcript=Cvel_7671.t1 / gene=Cvel_7671 / organism=Chromera_velia_CCMP2878 / gene_product=hypothetical protein / transcript_product=hypothetical protein / location=Cvel_scaffold407:22421-24118(+) / protein_length=180 / sequence_SO=supercontig / SO=protein_coding / is_pseudo=false